MHQDDPALGGLPAPGEPVFYPKVGHCVYRGLTEDRAAPGKQLVELEDLEEGSRILIPTERVPNLGLRPAGRALEDIQQELSSEFEQSLEDEVELDGLIERLVNDGSPRSLAKGLKRLHLLRQTTGLSREEEQTRRKIRSWLAAEVAISKDCTRAEAQALITRVLQEAMNAHRRKEREDAKERRRQVKALKAAEDLAHQEAEEAEAEAERQASLQVDPAPTPAVDEPEQLPVTPEPVEPSQGDEEEKTATIETPPSSDAAAPTDDAAEAEPARAPLEESPEEPSTGQESRQESHEASAGEDRSEAAPPDTSSPEPSSPESSSPSAPSANDRSEHSDSTNQKPAEPS